MGTGRFTVQQSVAEPASPDKTKAEERNALREKRPCGRLCFLRAGSYEEEIQPFTARGAVPDTNGIESHHPATGGSLSSCKAGCGAA